MYRRTTRLTRRLGDHGDHGDHGQAPVVGSGVLEGLRWESPAQIGGNPADGRKHADPAVLQLGLAQDVDWVAIREAKRVETLLTSGPALELIWVVHEWQGWRLLLLSH